jgi:hypothetical protein
MPAYLSSVTLSDRLRRWWNPGKWRDEHPEPSDGEGFDDTEQRLIERRSAQQQEHPPYTLGDR